MNSRLCVTLLLTVVVAACSDAKPEYETSGSPPAMPVYPVVEEIVEPPQIATWDRSWTARGGGLPDVRWLESSAMTHAIVPMASAPFPFPGQSFTDSSVLIAFPNKLDRDRPISLIAHMHGFDSELRATVSRGRLLEQFQASGVNAVLVVPQGPLLARSGDFGKLMEPRGFQRLAKDVAALLARDGFVSTTEFGRIALSAHSGGYQAVAQIVLLGGLKIDAVLLFDALYGKVDIFKGFILGGGRFRSLFTGGGGTYRQNMALRSELDDAGMFVSYAARDPDSNVVIAYSHQNHSDCLHAGRPFAWWLSQSGLPLL